MMTADGEHRDGAGAHRISERRAAASATPIIFLHGVGSDKSVWRPQLDHFGQARRAVAFDYPGYGESEFVEGATRDDFAAADPRRDGRARHRARPCLRPVARRRGRHRDARTPRRDRCASLIIADSFAVHPDGQGIHDRSVAASRSMTMRELAEARAGRAARLAPRPMTCATRWSRRWRRSIPPPIGIGAAAVWLADQRDRAAAIDVPTLILVGDEDRITPPALSRGTGRADRRIAAGTDRRRPAISPTPSSRKRLTRRLNPFSPNSG